MTLDHVHEAKGHFLWSRMWQAILKENISTKWMFIQWYNHNKPIFIVCLWIELQIHNYSFGHKCSLQYHKSDPQIFDLMVIICRAITCTSMPVHGFSAILKYLIIHFSLLFLKSKWPISICLVLEMNSSLQRHMGHCTTILSNMYQIEMGVFHIWIA